MTAPGARIVKSSSVSRPFYRDSKLHEALPNLQLKLLGKMWESIAEDFARISIRVLLALWQSSSNECGRASTKEASSAQPAAHDDGRTAQAVLRHRRMDVMSLFDSQASALAHPSKTRQASPSSAITLAACTTTPSQHVVFCSSFCACLGDVRRTDVTEALISANKSCGMFNVCVECVHVCTYRLLSYSVSSIQRQCRLPCLL